MWQQSLGVTITANKKYLHPTNIREKYSNITLQNIQYPEQKISQEATRWRWPMNDGSFLS